MEKRTLLVLLLLFSGIFTFARDSVQLNRFHANLQFRPRLEYRNGAFRPLSQDEHPALLISNRLRLGITYSHTDFLETKITFQQISLWGQAAPVQSFGQQNNNIGLFEGWVDLKIYKGIRTKIGRQTIKLDDQRLFSESDWSQGGRTHDALLVYYADKRWGIRTYFAFNQNYAALYKGDLNNPSGNFYNSDGAQPYKFMQTLWLCRQLSSLSKLNFLLSNIGYQQVELGASHPDTTISQLQTFGGHYSFAKKTVRFNLSAYYQLGRNTLRQKVSAYLLSAGISGQLSSKLHIYLRSDYLSGNSIHTPANTTHAFSMLFGTGHLFYGQMDYYPFSDVGLWNQALSINFTPGEKTKLKVAGHWFSAGHTFERNSIVYQQNLGQEIDVNFIYKLNAFTGFSAGYSIYFANKNIEALKNISHTKPLQDWFWLSLNVSPQFFKTRF